MELLVIGTGSRGNMYVLMEKEQRLILDAGMPVRLMIRAMNGIHGIEGCLVTHEHQDHVCGAPDLMGYGIDVYATPGTIEKAGLNGERCRTVRMGTMFSLPHFLVLPFPTRHDAQEPCGFLIRHIDTGITILYATDTYYLPNKFPLVNFWLVECNYSDEIVREQEQTGMIEKALLNRLRRSHMSLARLKETLSANDLSVTRKIVLLHLSDGRSNEKQMVSEITELTGIETVAADAGLIIPLDMEPF